MSRRCYLLAGPDGAGKTTLYKEVIRPATGLPFVNADEIARDLAGEGPITGPGLAGMDPAGARAAGPVAVTGRWS